MALTGVTGLPGVSTFYCNDGDQGSLRSALGTFYGHMLTNWPTGMTFTVEQAGDVIDVATGTLTAAWPDTTSYTGTSSVAAAPYAAGVGARVRWITGGVHNGRRVYGSTFIVPLQTGMYGNDGTLDSSYIGSLMAWAGSLVVAGSMKVYCRPDPVKHPGVAGAAFSIVSAQVKDQVSTLRSRRFCDRGELRC